MSGNKKRRPVLAHHGGKGKTFVTILHHAPDFVQWATGAIGCSIFWSHGIMWALHMEQFNFHMMALSAALIAISAYMEVTHNENV